MSDLTIILGGLMALILAVVGGSQYLKQEGRKDAERDAKEADQERAGRIRDRVERDLPDRVREYEGRGFRDRP